MLIRSTQNQRVKDVVKLRDRRARDERNCFVIDGAREIARAIVAGVELLEAFVCESLCHSPESRTAHRALEKVGATIHEVTPDVFEKLAFGDRADGVVVVARSRQTALGDLKLPTAPLVAVLEGVEKPGNLGAVLRSADGAGLSAVIVADDGADFHNPNAIRASLGAVFSVPTCAADSRSVAEWISERGLAIYATRVDAERLYTEVDWRGPSAVILGSEAHGLSEAWRSPAITGIRLPMHGDADSLNVSATAAVIFYEALRQRSG